MDIVEIKKIWEAVKAEIKETIPASTYEPWITPMEPIGFENNQFSVLTGQALAISIIRQNHYKEIAEAFKKILGHDVDFNIVFDEELAKKIKKI